MEVETFFENFELLTDAPNATAKLQEVILQLLVKGKLVLQNANDKPVNLEFDEAFVKRILGKRISKARIAELDIAEYPFNLPDNWHWKRLGDIGVTQTGTTPPTNNSEFYGIDYPFIKPADISASGVTYKSEGLSRKGIEKGRLVPANSVLMVSIGGSIGKVGLVDRDCSCNQQINYITLKIGILPELVYYLLKSPYFQEQVLSLAPSTTMPIISKGKWDTIPMPIPPLAEQKRIVEKCDRLLILCDEIEKRQQQRQASLLKMNEGAIGQLLAAQNPDDFQHHWQRICNNFDLLYSIPETISNLRQAIVQLAFQGKLVPQISTEEPANILLKKILDEKSKKEQQNPVTEKVFAEGEDDEFFFDLSSGWSYTKLGDICSLFSGYAFKSSSYISASKNQIIRLGNVKNDMILLDQSPVFISDEVAIENEKFLIRQGDLLITMTGTKNKRDFCFTAIVEKRHLVDTKLYLNQRVGCIRLIDSVCTELINIFLKSNTVSS